MILERRNEEAKVGGSSQGRVMQEIKESRQEPVVRATEYNFRAAWRRLSRLVEMKV
jgi:hypothetical protein